MKSHTDAKNPHSQYLQIASALAEIKDAGLVADVLKNLGLGDAAKKTVGSGSGQLPDMSSFTSSLLNNGWQKLPGGMILQWGLSENIQPGSNGATNFPIAFPKAALCVIATFADSASVNRAIATNISAMTRTAFASRNNDSLTSQFRYFAIGY